MKPRRTTPRSGLVAARLRAVPSKSVTHRALVAGALARGTTTIRQPLDADDGRITLAGLSALGFATTRAPGVWTVAGRGGTVPGGGTVALEESGTSFRFLVALAALGERASVLDGAPRLRERPVTELATALRALGADVRLDPKSGGLPLETGGAAPSGGRVTIAAGRSSQFASALMLIGAALPGGLEVELEPDAVSVPYIEITERVLRAFGVDVRRVSERCWTVAEGGYAGADFTVEGDHSSASYLLAAAAVCGGRLRCDGLDPESAQPDAALTSILEQAGCTVERGDDHLAVEGGGTLRAFDLDAGAFPDLVPTLAVLALFADGPCRMGGIAHLRLKESDRLAVLAENLNALGARAEVGPDSLTVDGAGRSLSGTEIRTHGDHRMAMAFAIAGLRIADVVIDDPACVAKSNPSFWEQFAALEG